jgi:hypothetical protein
MKTKIIVFIMLFSIFTTIIGYASPLTVADNGVAGEITVQYDGEINPLVLLPNKTINLTLTIENDNYINPQMYMALFENNKLKIIQVVNPTANGNKLNFQTAYQLPDDLTNYTMGILLWQNGETPVSNKMQLVNVLKPIIYTFDIHNRINTVTYQNKIIHFNYDYSGNLYSKWTTLVQQQSVPNNEVEAFANAISNVSEQTEPIEETPAITNDTSSETIINTPMNDIAAKCFVGVEYIDGICVTIYDLSLLDDGDLIEE